MYSKEAWIETAKKELKRARERVQLYEEETYIAGADITGPLIYIEQEYISFLLSGLNLMGSGEEDIMTMLANKSRNYIQRYSQN